MMFSVILIDILFYNVVCSLNTNKILLLLMFADHFWNNCGWQIYWFYSIWSKASSTYKGSLFSLCYIFFYNSCLHVFNYNMYFYSYHCQNNEKNKGGSNVQENMDDDSRNKLQDSERKDTYSNTIHDPLPNVSINVPSSLEALKVYILICCSTNSFHKRIYSLITIQNV